jgi:hypothetical protein
MIKRIFQCDSIPLSILSVVLTLGIFIGAGLFGTMETCTSNSFAVRFPSLASGALKYILIGMLLISIPIGYRRSVGRTGILDINERVSLYPIALVLLTVLPSCNNLLFLTASGLILLLFSRIVRIKEGESASPAAFGGGVIIALCAWISPYFLFLTLFLWLALSTLNNLSWRVIIWSLLGLISPMYFYYTLSYILSGTIPAFDMSGLLAADPINALSGLRIWWILYLVVFIALFVLLVLRSIRAAGKGIVIRRKLIRLGIILLIIMGGISALIFQFEGASPFMSLMAIPMAIIFQEMYRSGKGMVYSISFLLWLVLTVIISWA